MRIQIFLRAIGLVCAIFLFQGLILAQGGTVTGTIYDKESGETLIGANIILKGTSTGTVTDIDGKFSLDVDQNPPFILIVKFIGYNEEELTINSFEENQKVFMSSNQVLMSEVEIVGRRISEKQQQAALTAETMDVIAIKEVPAGNFYEGLANMKGVDMTSASLGFKVLNTRGFNSTSPVRSLQLIDGVDNQSPGLNFSLGNFLGASDLDVMKVDIISGASSAFYGPGAFNGVIDITSKNPFMFPGLSVQLKGGERNMVEGAFRWAQIIENKEGEEKFAYKINFFYMRADDWRAENYDPSFGTPEGRGNPGGYDAINIYGDEQFTTTNFDYTSPIDQLFSPGLGRFYRTGYREADLVDYDVDNIKFNTALHYKITDKLELSYDFRYSTGSTVYQGDNRYRLDNIQFVQNKIEISQEDKFFFRLYSTHEDAGDTYDIVQTAFLMNSASSADANWNTQYANRWNNVYADQVEGLPGYPEFNFAENGPVDNWANNFLQPFLQENLDSLMLYHQETREYVDGLDATFTDPRYEPGTARFDSLFNDITARTFTENGSRFYDKSALYHGQGAYYFNTNFGKVTVGGDFRFYTPDSRGTIFSDTLTYQRERNTDGDIVRVDSSFRKITNYQYGAFAGLEKNFIDEKLKASIVIRGDKNENFDPVFSPAASLVYSPNINNTFRFTFTSAVRNPTMADQFLFYDVGRAILLGNVDGRFESGRDSLITVDSFQNYRRNLNTDTLEYFNVDAIRPEKVRTVELGYRGILWERLYVDLTYYFSIYQDFIGFQIGLNAEFDEVTGLPVGGIQPYRVSANALENVTTQGFSIGTNYYFGKYTLNGNYSFNKLVSGEDDPIIPAFNTPENKFNVGISARDFKILGSKPRWGFGVNYKWIEGFLFEGSPQFTGNIDSYDLVDAQISYTTKFSSLKNTTCQFKLGASNLLNNEVFQVYGGPTVGRLAYFSVLFEFNNR